MFEIIEPDKAFEKLLNSIEDMPRQIQMMIDSVVALQELFPMPDEGWEQFARDVEYTNKKHGWNLCLPDRRRSDAEDSG